MRGFTFSSSKSTCVHFCRRKLHALKELKIKDSIIKYQDHVRYLGIHYDKRLNFHHHIQTLINKCKKDLNVMRCLSNTKWGADREALLKLHSALILSKMQYGAIAYANSPNYQLKALDAVHHAGIRCALGALRTSPVQSLLCDAGIPPLENIRSTQILNYTLQIRTKSDHINFPTFVNAGHPSVNDSHERKHRKSAFDRAHILMKDMNLSFDNVIPLCIYQTPPWIIPEIKCHTDLSIYKKGGTSNIIYKALFEEVLNQYEDKICIYTDGSKTKHGVGYAFHVGSESYSWTMSKYASIYTAEISAIWRALVYYAEKRVEKNVIICTDSLSAIHKIKDTLSTEGFTHKIVSLIHNLRNSGKEVIFLWTPAHTGIYGNEEADKAARAATEQPTTDNNISVADLKLEIKRCSMNLWQETWNQNTTQLREIKESVEKWEHPPLSRKDSVILTRLRIGHTWHTSGHILRKEEPPKCEICKTRLTIKHIILECSKYSRSRRKHRLYDTLNENLKSTDIIQYRTLPFIKEIGLFSKI
ncbi:PREDICTED: uncharacterized protein LOC108578249 [Habropoda laboriosa]|uniref:uncharacterized protein LOC108578249 n=1 Tax=Habropoda laboriosa TaxID=597456 RepID=UPI00083DA57D|nr:PREDICTED: uncharacterized protein LOC108578249 [Habropoda laboriosa]